MTADTPEPPEPAPQAPPIAPNWRRLPGNQIPVDHDHSMQPKEPQ